MLRRFFVKIHKSIWFTPSLYSILASCLALITVLIDTSFNEEVKAFIPTYFRTSVDLAQTILGTLSGALLTMTTITFSTIMVVLTMYSSQFSPRTLQNFLNSPSTQRVLGLFMGGFVYSILSLLFMRKQSISHEVISASVGVLIAVVCVAFFAFFIHNVGTSIQVSRLIRELADDVLRTIATEMKDTNDVVSLKKKPPISQGYSLVTEIQSQSFGYIQYINYEKIIEWATTQKAIIDIETPIGSFAGTQSILARVYHNDEISPITILSAFTLGEERSILQDIEYGIDIIAEIALRALSPGINDPNTAVRCIHSIGEVVQQASHLPMGVAVTYTNDHKPCLLSTRPIMSDYLYAAFSQISFYGKEDVSVLNAMLETLLYLANNNSSSVEMKTDIHNIADYIWNRFDHTVLEPLDLKRIESKRHTLRILLTV